MGSKHKRHVCEQNAGCLADTKKSSGPVSHLLLWLFTLWCWATCLWLTLSLQSIIRDSIGSKGHARTHIHTCTSAQRIQALLFSLHLSRQHTASKSIYILGMYILVDQVLNLVGLSFSTVHEQQHASAAPAAWRCCVQGRHRSIVCYQTPVNSQKAGFSADNYW